MAHVGKQRTILFIDCLPIGAVKLLIVEILALNPPGFPINILPLSAGIDTHFHLRNVKWSIAYFDRCRPISSNDPPTSSSAGARLIEQFLLVS